MQATWYWPRALWATMLWSTSPSGFHKACTFTRNSLETECPRPTVRWTMEEQFKQTNSSFQRQHKRERNTGNRYPSNHSCILRGNSFRPTYFLCLFLEGIQDAINQLLLKPWVNFCCTKVVHYLCRIRGKTNFYHLRWRFLKSNKTEADSGKEMWQGSCREK